MDRRIRTFAAIISLLFFGAALPALGDGLTLFVRAEGSDRQDGRSPASALRSIQRAVALATGSGNTIVVGPGIYYESISIGSGAGASAGSGTTDAPNLLLADPGGVRTGDSPAPVVIDGDGVHECGVRLHDRRCWRIAGFTFRGQASRALEADGADGLTIESCTIHVPVTAGVEVRETAGVRIAQNSFIRDLEGGTCISLRLDEGDEPPRDNHRRRGRDAEDDHADGTDDAHDDDRGRPEGGRRPGAGPRQIRTPAEIESNRLTLTGPLYLAGGMNDPGAGRRGRGSDELFGIDAHATGPGALVHIANNVISDCLVGIRVRLEDAGASALVAHNSIAGCRVGIDLEAKQGSVLAADNIIAHCHFALAAEGRTDRVTISGLLACDVQALMRGRGHAAIDGLIESGAPQWTDPASGDFAPTATSLAVDVGQGRAALAADLLGRVRPIDGDGDGRAVVDLGAVERDPQVDAGRLLQLVRWREIER